MKHVDGTEQGQRWVWMEAQWKAAGNVKCPAYERNPGEVWNGAVKSQPRCQSVLNLGATWRSGGRHSNRKSL